MYKSSAVAGLGFLTSLIALAVTSQAAPPTDFEEVVVTATFRQQSLSSASSSVTVLDDVIAEDRGAQHLEEIINLAPNVNFARGSSRTRFFQIRGIGDRGQFQEPINPSVGLIIDDVDYSGIGTVGTLFDISQVEVLRGSQGTHYGANALAGLINIVTNQPTDELSVKLRATVGDYNSQGLGMVLNGPLSDNLLGRIAIEQFRSDGYVKNTHLNDDDTDNRDELTVRAKLKLLVSENLSIDMSLTHIDIDNGYDGFSLDNSRNTVTDQPGNDRQQTDAYSIQADWAGADSFVVEASLSYTDSELEYGYDEDWTFDGFHPFGYKSTDTYLRDRQSSSGEVRLQSTDHRMIFNESTAWTIGLFALSTTEELTREYTFAPVDFTSDYDTDALAAYLELDTAITDRLHLITGLRWEHRESDYFDSDGVPANADDNNIGGKLMLEYQWTEDTFVYGGFSRGFRAGGVNSNPSLTPVQREFDSELLNSIEAGLKTSLFQGKLQLRTAIFYSERRDQQIEDANFIPVCEVGNAENCGGRFENFIQNGGDGNNYGIELEADWSLSPSLQAFVNVGMLRTEIDSYKNANNDDLSGRDQAHAPEYQFATGISWQITEAFAAQLEVEGRDEFYYSEGHNAQSDAYALLNGSVKYATDHWQVSLWGRNLSDKDYAVRGFRFGNDPRTDYATTTYEQLGEPRMVGATLSVQY